MKTFVAISDPILPSGVYQNWTFYVESSSSNVVFKCSSRKKVVSKSELYRLVESSLPDGYAIGHLMGAKAGSWGHSFIEETTDLQFVFDFICD